MSINQFVDSTGTTLNQYTLKESGQTDRTIQLEFAPSQDYIAGTSFSANTMNPIVNAINGAETDIDVIQTQIGNYCIWCGTQAEYDAIATKDTNTLYFIKES